MPHRHVPARRPRSVVGAVLSLMALTTLLAGFVLAAVAAPSSAAAPSRADDDIERTIVVTLNNSAEADAPVEGVTITVTDPSGEEFSGETDADGTVEIDVVGPSGALTIALDESTLPDGAELRDGAGAERTVNLGISRIPIDFQIGPDTRDVRTAWDKVPQLIYSGLTFGIVLALGALGLSMVFGTTGLTNFAHGEIVSFGAMITFFLSVTLGLPFILAVPVTVVVAMAFGWVQDTALWKPLRRRGIGLIAMMIVSIGLQFFLRNVYGWATGSRSQNYDEYLTPSGISAGGVFTYTIRDVVISLICIAILVAVILALTYTRLGRATRAVADNPALAAATGINVDRVISIVWVVGTALAALCGTFLAFKLGVTYQIGQLTLLLLFAACCVGGLGSVWGALVGSLIIGVLIDLSTLVIPAELKNGGALVLLIVILLVRPQGLLGRRERIG